MLIARKTLMKLVLMNCELIFFFHAAANAARFYVYHLDCLIEFSHRPIAFISHAIKRVRWWKKARVLSGYIGARSSKLCACVRFAKRSKHVEQKKSDRKKICNETIYHIRLKIVKYVNTHINVFCTV